MAEEFVDYSARNVATNLGKGLSLGVEKGFTGLGKVLESGIGDTLNAIAPIAAIAGDPLMALGIKGIDFGLKGVGKSLQLGVGVVKGIVNAPEAYKKTTEALEKFLTKTEGKERKKNLEESKLLKEKQSLLQEEQKLILASGGDDSQIVRELARIEQKTQQLDSLEREKQLEENARAINKNLRGSPPYLQTVSEYLEDSQWPLLEKLTGIVEPIQSAYSEETIREQQRWQQKLLESIDGTEQQEPVNKKGGIGLPGLGGLFGNEGIDWKKRLEELMKTVNPMKWLGLGTGAAAFGAGALTKFGLPAIIGGSAILTAYNGIQGYLKADEWEQSKFSATLGGMLGGTGEGGPMQALIQGFGTGAQLAWLGSKVGGPVGAVAGGIIGAALGGVSGYFGGQKTGDFISKLPSWTAEAWQANKEDAIKMWQGWMNADWIKKMREDEKNFSNVPKTGNLFQNLPPIFREDGGAFQLHRDSTENHELKGQRNANLWNRFFYQGGSTVNNISNNTSNISFQQNALDSFYPRIGRDDNK
tara:strand:+ start:2256 stop:3845 length:1590 start_codon:yes stop_codon:yes gene_type:complete